MKIFDRKPLWVIAALLALSVVMALKKNWTSHRGMAIATGALVAAGVVTKATFLPLLAIPLFGMASLALGSTPMGRRVAQLLGSIPPRKQSWSLRRRMEILLRAFRKR